MDLIAAKLGANMAISELLVSGQIGGGESKIITYDGNGEKVDILGNGETYAKVSAEYVNGNNISKIVRAVAENNGELAGEVVYTKAELGIEVTDIATMVSYNDTLLVISAVADIEGVLEKGTYVLDKIMGVEGDKAYTWISSIEYGTLHTIDPKYLPGLTLPTVELSEATATAMMGGGEPTLTDEEAAKLDSLLLTYSPFMMTAKMQGMVAGVCMCQYALDFSSFMPTYAGCMYYQADGGGVNLSGFQFKKTESGWIARMISGIAYHG